jgi:site-specific DNA recombinase
MKAAIYSRKSKFSEKGDSIENQLTLCEEYGRSIGVTSFIKYEDEGFSGGNTNRPQFKAMMKDAKAKKFDVLICYRLDRISRNVSDFTYTIDELKKHSIGFISIREQFDTTTPMGRAMMNIAAVFAQLERETIAERIKDNMLELAKTGRWLGGTPPLGYRSEPVEFFDDNGKPKKLFKLALVPEEIEIVKLTYDLFLEKKNYSSVASYLCRNNYKGKSGGEFSRQTVMQIITNPVYCIADDAILNYFRDKGSIVCGNPEAGNFGLMVYNKREGGKHEKPVSDWIISIGRHEALIDSDNWIKCAMIQEKNNSKVSAKASTGEKFLLSGLLICGHCGSSMASWSHMNKRTNQMERYYRCNLKQRAANRCTCKMLNADFAQDHIHNFISEVNPEAVIKELQALKETILNTNNEYKEVLIHKEEIDKNNKAMQGLIRKFALMDDDIEIIQIFKDQINEIRAKNAALENRIQELTDKKELVNSIDFDISLFTSSLDRFKEFSKYITVPESRDLLLNLIDHIVWNSDDQTLKVNWIGCGASVIKKDDAVNSVLCIRNRRRQNYAAGSKRQC